MKTAIKSYEWTISKTFCSLVALYDSCLCLGHRLEKITCFWWICTFNRT